MVNEGGSVWRIYVGHSGFHPFLYRLPRFHISSAIIPSVSQGCWVYLGGISIVNVSCVSIICAQVTASVDSLPYLHGNMHVVLKTSCFELLTVYHAMSVCK